MGWLRSTHCSRSVSPPAGRSRGCARPAWSLHHPPSELLDGGHDAFVGAAEDPTEGPQSVGLGKFRPPDADQLDGVEFEHLGEPNQFGHLELDGPGELPAERLLGVEPCALRECCDGESTFVPPGVDHGSEVRLPHLIIGTRHTQKARTTLGCACSSTDETQALLDKGFLFAQGGGVDTTRRPQLRPVDLAELWGRCLKSRRVELNLSQNQLARIADMTQQAIWQFEHGKRIPLDRTKVQLARALGTTPGELFPWPDMEDLADGDAA